MLRRGCAHLHKKTDILKPASNSAESCQTRLPARQLEIIDDVLGGPKQSSTVCSEELSDMRAERHSAAVITRIGGSVGIGGSEQRYRERLAPNFRHF